MRSIREILAPPAEQHAFAQGIRAGLAHVAVGRVEVTRRVRFEAAHFLPDYQGSCSQVHGHSWSAEITVSGGLNPSGPERGMVEDMGRIASFFKMHVEPDLDHRVLNDTLPEEYHPPTTENVARYLLDRFADAGFAVCRVTVRETENQTATVFA